jgi:hypothetical protein
MRRRARSARIVGCLYGSVATGTSPFSLISQLLLSLEQTIAYYCNQCYFVQILTLQHTYTGKVPTLLFTELPLRGVLGNSHAQKDGWVYAPGPS